ncbi:MAG: hypothetical protein CMI09_12335 [Oceanospirillaceae bacterium]|nr:hypothetical protein [Oceanospirillaceae bacterium]|tara:strand:- start:183 stop:392 length:210 start_codon:yes stop_codon:yes gene_type:complete
MHGELLPLPQPSLPGHNNLQLFSDQYAKQSATKPVLMQWLLSYGYRITFTEAFSQDKKGRRIERQNFQK